MRCRPRLGLGTYQYGGADCRRGGARSLVSRAADSAAAAAQQVRKVTTTATNYHHAACEARVPVYKRRAKTADSLS